MKLKNYFGAFFKTRAAGFYLAAAACLLSLITFFLYLGYGLSSEGRQYFSATALILTGAGVLAFLPALFRKTAAVAPYLQAGFVFASFLCFLYACYRYFTVVFYGGVTMSAIGRMNGMFAATLVLFLCDLIVSEAAIYCRQERAAEKEATHE